MAGLSLERRHIPCLVKPALLVLPHQARQGLCQQPRLWLAGAGPPEMVTLSWGLLAACRETSRGWVSLSTYILCYAWIPLGFLPGASLQRDVGCVPLVLALFLI